MKVRKFTEDELFAILHDFDNHISLDHIAETYGRTKTTLYVMSKLWERIKEGRDNHYRSDERLVILMKQYLALQGKPTLIPELPVAQKETISPLERIEKAFEVFQTELVIAVNDEAERRAEERTDEIKKEYEERLEKMQQLLDTAKESNLAGFLRKAWGKSEVNQ